MRKISDGTALPFLRATDILEVQRIGLNVDYKVDIATAMQFTRNHVQSVEFKPNITTTIAAYGDTHTPTGTIFHPAVNTTIGRLTNFGSAASTNATAGTSETTAARLRGNNTGPFQGFLMHDILGLLDASYNESGASTGTRIFAGFTDSALATLIGSDAPTGNHAGFFRCSVNGGLTHSTWQFMTNDNSTPNYQDTGLTFSASALYEMMIYCAGNATEIFWAIRNITAGTAWVYGSTTLKLPSALAILRSGFQLITINATARNIQMASHYAAGLWNRV